MAPDENPGPIENALLQAIERSGLSANQIAQRAGVSASMVSRWLAGTRGLSLQTADRIAVALNVTASQRKGRK